tara:strand:- start:1874 stop:2542 length:669 start_codon:yes stop_codon:yes gene_type:complete
MKTVIFDLDGTLADTSADLISAANFCFASLGYPKLLDYEKDAGVAMRGGRAMLELGCQKIGLHDERFINQQYPILLDAYSKCLVEHTEFFPYALDAVRKLKLLGINSAICTNKPFALAEELMMRLGARHLFKELIGADTLSFKKPHPAPFFAAVKGSGGIVEQSLLVGDTLTDFDTAKAAGVPIIMVDFGFEGFDFSRSKPDAVLKSFLDLPEIVMRLLKFY